MSGSSDEPVTRRETEQKALALARAAGEESARFEARFNEQRRDIDALKREHEQFRLDLAAVAEQVKQLAASFQQNIAVSTALAKQLKENNEKQVTNRTLIMTAIGLFFGLGMLLIAGVALVHGQSAP